MRMMLLSRATFPIPVMPLPEALQLAVLVIQFLRGYLEICSDKRNYQSLETAPAMCWCGTTNSYFICGLLIFI